VLLLRYVDEAADDIDAIAAARESHMRASMLREELLMPRHAADVYATPLLFALRAYDDEARGDG